VAGIRDITGCAPSRAVPVIAFHGTDDPIVAYGGGYGPGVANLPNGAGGTIGSGAVDATSDEPSIEAITDAWAGRNGCDTGPDRTEGVAADVSLLTWACPRGADVELFRVNGGGHTWPGSAVSGALGSLVGSTTMSVSANEAMWAFFVAHPRRVRTTCERADARTRDASLGVREYRVSVPPIDGPLPLVIDLHGYGEHVRSHASATGFESLGRTHGFVTITPQGRGEPPRWDLGPDGADVRFITDLLDEVERELCIDTRRIYVTGHSMGAFLLSQLACSPLASRVSAWAPVAGLREVPDCPTSGEPVLVAHGTADATVLYSGGLSPAAAEILGMSAAGPPIPDLVDAWAARNGCPGTPPVERTETALRTWISYPCDVELLRLDQAPHVWPDGGAEDIWRFFAAHAR
jgi:poly(3-hydroxybutyrate) depolymerase